MEGHLKDGNKEVKNSKQKKNKKNDTKKSAVTVQPVEEIETEQDNEENDEDPSIWEVDLKNIGGSAEEDATDLTPDERAIAAAVAEVEKELKDEQFRENPSIWDLNPEVVDTTEKSIWEVNLNEVDNELKGIKHKKNQSVDSRIAEDDIAISEAIAEVEQELEEETEGQNPSIWEVDLKNVGDQGDDDEETDEKKELTPDEKAIAAAVAEVEKELKDEQFRENPSIWDLNPEVVDTTEKSIWEVNLNEVDNELKGIKHKKNRSVDSCFAEDDIAISEAIAEVEQELEEEAEGQNPSIWEVDLNVGAKNAVEEDKFMSPDEKAIADVVAQIEREIEEEEFRENPSIWDIVGKDTGVAAYSAGTNDQEQKNMTVDERAIAEAIAQVEKELEEEQFRENPSIWDLNGEIHDDKSAAAVEKSVWEVNLRAIDEDLKELSPRQKGKKKSGVNAGADITSSPEDDVAIAEAISQVEKELKREKTAESSLWMMGLVIAGGLVASKLISSWFAKNA